MLAQQSTLARQTTLAHNLATRAGQHGERLAVAFTTGDGRWERLSYAQFAARSDAVADLLRSLLPRCRRPQFVLIMLPSGPEYLISLYGCLAAGAVAIPFYPPTVLTGRTVQAFGHRLRQIHRDCAPGVIVAPRALAELVTTALADPSVVVLAAEDLPPGTTAASGRIDARPGDLALLQYTSGSTRDPMGVMQTHDNLAHNVRVFAGAVGSAEGESIATWLPLFHDLGLIGAVLHPLAAGMSVHLTTPAAFVRRPALWLDIATRARASLMMAPNFAYDMCVRWVPEDQRAGLDLSGVRSAINGAEPVRHATIEAFVKAYERHGFRPSAMAPAYGLAEATVLVCASDWRREPTLVEVSEAGLRRDGVARPADREPATVLVGCGPDGLDVETVIVDPERLSPCPPGTVGEIWVAGPSVAAGYWSRPEASERVFLAELDRDGRAFLRTGDLGLKLDGELFIVGRITDMIIQRGVNHSPQDVEFTAEQAHPEVRPGGAAVFTVPDGDAERVVVLCELVRYSSDVDHGAVVSAVRDAVAEVHGLDVAAVAVVRKGQIPKTTSGKVRRRESGARWLAGGFDTLSAWTAPLPARSTVS